MNQRKFFLILVISLFLNNLFAQSFVNLYGDATSNSASGMKYSSALNAYFVLGGDNGLTNLSCLDANKNLLWSKSYQTNGMSLGSFALAPNGEVVLAGWTTPSCWCDGAFFVMRVDANGNPIWANTYNNDVGNMRPYGVGILESDNDSYILHTWYDPNGGISDDFFFIKIDANGNLIWTRNINGGADDQVNTFASDKQGGVVFGFASGSIDWSGGFGHLDATGNLVGLYNCNAGYNSGQWLNCNGITKTNDGYAFTLGSHGSSGSNIETYLVKIDNSGNFQWANHYPYTPSAGWPWATTFTDNQGNVYLQSEQNYLGQDERFLLQFDNNGNLLQGVRNTNLPSHFFEDNGFPCVVSSSYNSSLGFGDYDMMVGKLDVDLVSCITETYSPNLAATTFNISAWNAPVGSPSMTISPASLPTVNVLTYSQSAFCNFSPYQVSTDTLTCDQLNCCPGCAPRVCIPLQAVTPVQSGIKGLDFCYTYDANLLTPTGNVTLGDVVTNGGNASHYINYTMTPGELHVSIAYNGQGELVGMGDIACIEFEMKPAFVVGTTACISVCELIESFVVGTETETAQDGCLTFLNDDILNAKLIYWDRDIQPLSYDSTNPNDYLVTNIHGADGNCVQTGTTTQPDMNGNFTHNINNGTSLDITRDIDCNTNVMPFINAMDCYWVSLITTLNPSYVPNPYQMVAADVDMNGKIAAGDITSIQNRILQNHCEYPQIWVDPMVYPNYLSGSNKDWRFIDALTTQTASDWQPSPCYPADCGGYSKYNVPNVPMCAKIHQTQTAFCTKIDSMDYHAILLGDVNGTWDGVTTPVALKTFSNNKVVFDLTLATKDANNCYINIPVYYEGNDNLMGLDFEMDYDEAHLDIMGNVSVTNGSLISASNDKNQSKLLFTTYSNVQNGIYLANTPFAWIKVSSTSQSVSPTDLGNIQAYFNGENANVEIRGALAECNTLATSITPTTTDFNLNLYPQPVADALTVEYNISVKTLELFDNQGKKVMDISLNDTNKTTVSVQGLASGIYFLRINGVSAQKVVKE